MYKVQTSKHGQPHTIQIVRAPARDLTMAAASRHGPGCARYNSVLWSPQYVSDIRAPEQVQRRFTKRLLSLRLLRYYLCIEQLGLQPLELRRLRDW